MSEAKGDLIFLLSRENGLFWFFFEQRTISQSYFLEIF